MKYVDGYVLAIPKKNVGLYKKMATKGKKIWMEHGALEYNECVGDDLFIKGTVPFPKLAKMKKGETIVFAYIVYKSRAHRDRVNAKVMNDPRLSTEMDPNKMPFDMKRMAYGGFKIIVRA